MSRNVPKLRFKGFEDEWKEKKLINFLSESRIPGSNGSKAKKLTVKLWAKGVVPKKEIYEGSDNTKYYTRKAGQLMYGKLDFLNCAFGIVPDHLDGYESTVDAPAFDIKNINPYFLFSKIIQKNFYKRNGDIADGSRKAKRIHSDVFLNMSIKVPSLEEQEKIANFLSRVDSIIEKQEKKVQYWNSYKKGMMQKIFSQKIRFKDENGRDYPEWKKVNLNKFVERVVRKNKDNVSKRPLTISAQYGLVDQEEFFNKLVASKNLEGYYLLKNGEFAYNKSYSTGYPFGAIKRLDKYENGAISTLYICFKVKNNINSDFIAQYFESSKWHNEIAMIAVEGARNHGLLNVSVSDFFETIHYIPCLEEQNKISKFLLNIDNILFKENKKLEELVQWKKGLLQQMFI